MLTRTAGQQSDAAYADGVDNERAPRLRPLPPAFVAAVAPARGGLGDAELYQALHGALAALPAAERSAAVLAFGLDEGVDGVADAHELAADDADALTRSALQLLRAALVGLDRDEPAVHARLPPRRRRRDG